MKKLVYIHSQIEYNTFVVWLWRMSLNRIDYNASSIRLGSFTEPDIDDYINIGKLGKTQVIYRKTSSVIQIEGVLPLKKLYRRVFELTLSKVKSNVYTIDMMAIDKQFQGFSITGKLYKMVMKKLNIILEAGQSQSPGGRGIWCSLSSVPGVQVFGANNRNISELFEMVPTEKGELITTCGIDPYEKGQFRIYARVI